MSTHTERLRNLKIFTNKETMERTFQRYTCRDLKIIENGNIIDKDTGFIRRVPSRHAPVKVFNPLTGRMVYVSNNQVRLLHNEHKIYYDDVTNTIEVLDEKLKAKVEKRKQAGKKVTPPPVVDESDCYESDYNANYEDCFDEFTWDEEGNIYFDF